MSTRNCRSVTLRINLTLPVYIQPLKRRQHDSQLTFARTHARVRAYSNLPVLTVLEGNCEHCCHVSKGLGLCREEQSGNRDFIRACVKERTGFECVNGVDKPVCDLSDVECKEPAIP